MTCAQAEFLPEMVDEMVDSGPPSRVLGQECLVRIQLQEWKRFLESLVFPAPEELLLLEVFLESWVPEQKAAFVRALPTCPVTTHLTRFDSHQLHDLRIGN